MLQACHPLIPLSPHTKNCSIRCLRFPDDSKINYLLQLCPRAWNALTGVCVMLIFALHALYGQSCVPLWPVLCPRAELAAKDRYKISRKVAAIVAAQRTDWIEQVTVFKNAALDAALQLVFQLVFSSCRSLEASKALQAALTHFRSSFS